MKIKNINLYLLLSFFITLSACKNDDDNVVKPEPTQSTLGSVKFMFDNKVDDTPLQFNKDYVIHNSDTIQISALKYFISNIVFQGEEMYKENNSYHLINVTADAQSIMFTVDSVPAGIYEDITFGLGVDSLANHNTAATGDLDPAGSDGMIWNWNTGYKFVKFEGKFRSDTTTAGAFVFHLGGDALYRTISLAGDTSMMHHDDNETDMHAEHRIEALTITVEASKTTTVHIQTNIQNFFKNPNMIDLDVMNSGHHGGNVLIENMAKDFFMLHHVEIGK